MYIYLWNLYVSSKFLNTNELYSTKPYTLLNGHKRVALCASNQLTIAVQLIFQKIRKNNNNR